MRKIAYIANSRIPSRQANTAHVLNMSEAFGEADAEVTLIARGDLNGAERDLEDFGISKPLDMRLLPQGPAGMLDRFRFIRHVRAVMGGERFDFAYGRSCYGLLAGVPGEIPFAYDIHDFPTRIGRRALETMLFRRPNMLFVTAISKALADRYADAFPRLRGRILVAPCAAKAPARSLLPTRGREPGPLRVYYVGHLYAGRGIDLIITIAASEPEIEFHVVGGEDRDIAYWKARAPTNVHFHGYLRPAGLAAHYRRADICVAPYASGVEVPGGGDTSAGMSPMKIFEYMAYAKALIASDLPVLREIISDDVDGILCPPGDVDGWREAIRRLRDDPQRIERLGTQAFRKFDREYTWEQRARRILDKAAEPGAGVTAGSKPAKVR